MGAFSIALSAWAVSTMTTQVIGAPADATTHVDAPALVRQQGDVLVVPGPTRIVSGFRMEGSPELEVVFGDVAHYRANVDVFYETLAEMATVRASFTRHVQAALVVASNQQGSCPEQTLAPLFYQAKTGGDRYRELGRAFETRYKAVHDLHSMGETAGLTPDYRWKVGRAAKLYESALTDFEEMRIAFTDQLAAELTARGCNTERLLRAGKDLPVPDLGELTSDPGPTRAPRKPPTIVPASTATFFVDNTACESSQQVYLDGVLLGDVPPASKAAFQALEGHHSFCIIETGSDAECGATGTVRTAHIHHAWSISVHCAK